MRPVKILTDSTNDLTPEQLRQAEVDILPLSVVFGSKSYRDGVDLNTEQLYLMVEKEGVLPKTSAIQPAVFESTFREWVEKGYDVIYIGIGSKISSSVQTGAIIASQFDGHVEVIDSMCLSSAIGLQVLRAAKLRDQGKNLQEIASEIRLTSPKVKCAFSIDTMDYLYKGGRCNGMTYLVGKLLHIHPIISVRDGSLTVYKTPRGKMEKALDIMIQDFKTDLEKGIVDLDHVMITHSMGQENAEYIYERLKNMVDPSIISITNAGCVISSHCGKKTCGILYITK